MNLHDHYPDSYLRDILRSVRTIAMVGASTNWKRPSFFVMKYLQRKGFRVIPVNPVSAGELLLGETVQSNLESIPEAVDMVDLFTMRVGGAEGQPTWGFSVGDTVEAKVGQGTSTIFRGEVTALELLLQLLVLHVFELL